MLVEFPYGSDARAVASDATAQRWNESLGAWEAHDDANWSDYLITPGRVGTSSKLLFVVPDDSYSVEIYGGTAPVVADLPIGQSQLKQTVAELTLEALASFASTDTMETAAGAGSVAKLAGQAASGVVNQAPVSQIPVAANRLWILGETQNGLYGQDKRYMQVGESKIFGFDFRQDMATNGRVQNVLGVAIKSGTAGGITFDTPNIAVDHSQAKIPITAITAGTYVINCRVTYASGDVAEGDGTLVVVT